MRISRVTKIRSCGVFRNFNWPADLHSFGQFNLIYGWNGCGKTTLSGLFANLEKRTNLSQGEIDFEIDENRHCTGSAISTTPLPPVRVFNRDFVATNVLAFEGGNIAPIFFLGEDSVEKQQQVERLRVDLLQAEADETRAKSKKSIAEKNLDDFCIAKAKLIKELLLSSHSTDYSNYDKRRFRQAIERLKSEDIAKVLLDDEKKVNLRKQKDGQPKLEIDIVNLYLPDLKELRTTTSTLLNNSVVSQVITALDEDREVRKWVQDGLALHTGTKLVDECRFCGSKIPTARLAALEAHFNDAYSQFQSEIDNMIGRIESERKRLETLHLPEPSRAVTV